MMINWQALSESQAQNTALAWDKGLEWESGQDGFPFLGFYDNERKLSFIWDGNVQTPVQVSHGGYGEPVSWKFWYNDHAEFPIDTLSEVHGYYIAHGALQFGKACKRWIIFKEGTN